LVDESIGRHSIIWSKSLLFGFETVGNGQKLFRWGLRLSGITTPIKDMWRDDKYEMRANNKGRKGTRNENQFSCAKNELNLLHEAETEKSECP
jgi:hypothetical protein